MSTATIEKRLSAIEAEVADIKEQLANGNHQATGTSSLVKQPTISEKLLAIANSIPEEERLKMPADLAEQHDHYIYGWPKK
jgi:hypothetical protein